VISIVHSLEIHIDSFSFLPRIDLDVIKPVSSLVVLSSYLRRNSNCNHNQQSRLIRTAVDKRFKTMINRNIQYSLKGFPVLHRKNPDSDNNVSIGTTRGQKIDKTSSSYRSDDVPNMDMSFSTLFN